MLAAAAVAASGCGLIVGIEDYERLPPALNNLEVSAGELEPPFSSDTLDYTLALPLGTTDVMIKPTPNDSGVTVAVNDNEVAHAIFSVPLALRLVPNPIVVEASAHGETRTYRINASRGRGLIQKLFAKASNTDVDDYFGDSLALSGDTMVVGAPLEDSSGADIKDDDAFNSGAVHVHRVQYTFSSEWKVTGCRAPI